VSFKVRIKIKLKVKKMSKSLFERLGGTEGISSIVDNVVENHMNNPAVKVRFLPYKQEPEKLAKIKQHTVDFFSAGSGGPAVYKGRDMPDTHRGMNISPSEYVEVMDDIFDALDKHSIDEDTKKDVLAILWSLKGTIIAK
jgi:hemoglobin